MAQTTPHEETWRSFPDGGFPLVPSHVRSSLLLVVVVFAALLAAVTYCSSSSRHLACRGEPTRSLDVGLQLYEGNRLRTFSGPTWSRTHRAAPRTTTLPGHTPGSEPCDSARCLLALSPHGPGRLSEVVDADPGDDKLVERHKSSRVRPLNATGGSGASPAALPAVNNVACGLWP